MLKVNGFVADESVGDRRDNEAMFERYSARARSVIFLALGCARRRGAAYIEPGDLLHALVRGETSPPPQNCLLAVRLPWSGSAVTSRPSSRRRSREVAENVGGPAQQRPGGEGRHVRFALLKQALHSAPVLRKNGTAEP